MKEYWEISSVLEKHNVIFSEFWDMGVPCFSKEIDTAAIAWDKEGHKINYLFNRDFWDSLDAYQRGFVISHEILHVLFKHGNRLKSIISSQQEMHIANIAADIVVNEFLLRKFKFDKFLLGDLYKILITEERATGKQGKLKTFEEYYAILKQQSEDESSNMESLDNHSKSFEAMDGFKADESDNDSNSGSDSLGGAGDIPDIVIEDIIEQAFEKQDVKQAEEIEELLCSGELKEALGGQLAGVMAGGAVKVIKRFKIIRKKKWITLVKDWTRRKIKESINETWIWPNRRLALFKDDELFLPADYIEEKEEKDKMNVWLFMDTSGSCVSYAERFFKAAEFIPTDYFTVRLFCFDTRVYETDLVSRKLYGFGGTRFDIIESEIQKIMSKEKKKYPDSVWILTDGYGNTVNPEFPSKWKWFMTGWSTNSYINKASEVYQLVDYE